MKRLCVGRLSAVAYGVLVLAALAMACGSDEDGLADATAAPEGSPRAGAAEPVDAIADYIANEGLDGERFELADPVDCAAIEDVEANAGKICLNFENSEIRETAAEIELDLAGSTPFWMLRLRLQGDTWVVTEVASGIRGGNHPAIEKEEPHDE